MTRALPLTPFCVCLVTVLSSTVGLATEIEDQTLKGLKGVFVSIEPFDADDKRAGFDGAGFRATAERKLRLSGITVLTQKQWLSTPGKPVLYVNVVSLATRSSRVAPFSISIQLKQSVNLKRNNVEVLATTWNTGTAGRADAAYVLASFDRQLDQFVRAWLSVNQ